MRNTRITGARTWACGRGFTLTIRLITAWAIVCFSFGSWAQAAGESPEVRRSWEDDFAGLQTALAKRDNPYYLLKPGQVRADVANIQALLWETDRTPADVALRRTEALLRHLKSLPKTPDLAALEKQLASAKSANTNGADPKAAYLAVRQITRAAVLANPLLDFDELIFNRWTSTYGHVQEAWAGSVRRDEGSLYILSGLKSGQVKIRNLLENSRFENGPYQGQRILDASPVVRSFDLSFDGKKVVFAWLQPSTPRALKIVTVNADGTGLRQLTDGPYDDLDPVWLPNGRIVFISTRIRLTVRCNFGGATPQAVMHSMNADGSDQVRNQLSRNQRALPQHR